MGKYMRKAKVTGDLAVKELSQSTLGVRTRAKTLALQQLNSSAGASPPANSEYSYLELRSRRLEKPPLVKKHLNRNQKSSVPEQSLACEGKENQLTESSPKEEGFENNLDSEIEASFGENNLDLEERGRRTRETTPCNFISDPISVSAPGSSTKRTIPTTANRTAQNPLIRNMPTPTEIEEFFAPLEKLQQSRFIEKYNFDILTDLPLPGRYEWERVTP